MPVDDQTGFKEYRRHLGRFEYHQVVETVNTELLVQKLSVFAWDLLSVMQSRGKAAIAQLLPQQMRESLTASGVAVFSRDE